MKKNLMLSLLLAMTAFSTQFVFAGNATTSEVRTSAPYHYIMMEGDAELILVPSDKFEITIEGSEEQLMNMSTLLMNDTLHIVQTNKKDRKNQRTKIFVGVSELKALHIKGRTDVNANGYINTGNISIKAEDGAVVNLDVRESKAKSKSGG